MWTMTEPKSSRTQCDAGVPSRPIGLVCSSRRVDDDAVRDGVELALRTARADDEVVGDGRERRQVEQHDVGGLLVLGELDDASGELERRRARSWARERRVAAGRRRWAGRLGGLRCRGRGRLAAVGRRRLRRGCLLRGWLARARLGRKRGVGHDRSSLLVGSIERMVADIGGDRIGHEIAQRAPGRRPRPKLRGGDPQVRPVEEDRPGRSSPRSGR